MVQVLINDATMVDIADAIREKTDTSNQMLPSEMGGGNKRYRNWNKNS